MKTQISNFLALSGMQVFPQESCAVIFYVCVCIVCSEVRLEKFARIRSDLYQ